jgi:hypothetical protein
MLASAVASQGSHRPFPQRGETPMLSVHFLASPKRLEKASFGSHLVTFYRKTKQATSSYWSSPSEVVPFPACLQHLIADLSAVRALGINHAASIAPCLESPYHRGSLRNGKSGNSVEFPHDANTPISQRKNYECIWVGGHVTSNLAIQCTFST